MFLPQFILFWIVRDVFSTSVWHWTRHSWLNICHISAHQALLLNYPFVHNFWNGNSIFISPNTNAVIQILSQESRIDLPVSRRDMEIKFKKLNGVSDKSQIDRDRTSFTGSSPCLSLYSVPSLHFSHLQTNLIWSSIYHTQRDTLVLWRQKH